MDTSFKNISRRKTKVTVLATYNLVRTYLQLLLEMDREISVQDMVGTSAELLHKISRNKPDVVLICLLEDEGKDLEVLNLLFQAESQTKVVILSSPNSALDQPAALKLGVTGIVGTNKSVRVLIRAIRQVSEGEVWLNQKLIAQLLGNGFSNGNSKKTGFYSENLTNRELEIVKMIGLGRKNKEISTELFISEATVRHHLSSIYSKLNIEDRLNLAIYAYQQKIVQPTAMGSI